MVANPGRRAFAFILLSTLVLFLATAPAHASGSILNSSKTITTLASTVPSNGDVNPYGVALVTRSVGNLQQGHILVSNFNNSANAQGTGSTIVDIAPNGSFTQFAQINASALPGSCPGGIGLTTALAVLRTGWVIVGSLPTTDGTSATAQPGCLIVLDSKGNPVETFFGSLINGPWDMTSAEGENEAQLFVTNVLNGTVAASPAVVSTATVVRIDLKVSVTQMPSVQSMTVIGSGFPARTDPAALVIGPTGVGLSAECAEDDDCQGGDDAAQQVLYVADSLSNRIAVIRAARTRTTSAGTGITLTSGGSLNDPLGMTVAPNGHILVVNGNDGFITEITASGRQIARTLLDNTGGPPPGNGTLFGLVFDPELGVVFVDDGSNTLNVLH